MKKIKELFLSISDWWNDRCEFYRTCKFKKGCDGKNPEYFDGFVDKAFCGHFRKLKYGGDAYVNTE